MFNEDGTLKDDAVASNEQGSSELDNRPSKDIYKSIFEPQSDAEGGDDSDREDAEETVVASEKSTSKRDDDAHTDNPDEVDMEAHKKTTSESDVAAAEVARLADP